MKKSRRPGQGLQGQARRKVVNFSGGCYIPFVTQSQAGFVVWLQFPQSPFKKAVLYNPKASHSGLDPESTTILNNIADVLLKSYFTSNVAIKVDSGSSPE